MPTTNPNETSTPALYLSNWKDLVGIWMGRRLAQTDTRVRGPSLGELHYLGGSMPSWSASQIVDYTAFFRDESQGAKYTQVGNFDAQAYFENSPGQAGVVVTRYGQYAGAAVQPRCRITRSYAAVPNQPFLVIRTTFSNDTAAAVDMNVLDQVHLANHGTGNPAPQVHAFYDAARNALVADMSASGQFFVVLGALQPMDGYQAADDTDQNPTSAAASGWFTFDRDGTLKKNGDLRATDVDLAFSKRVTVPAGESRNVDLYLTVRGDLASALAAADLARGQTADQWFAATDGAYQAWLSNGGKGVRPHLSDPGLNATFERSLILIKNAQNPVLGTFVATTNPFAYGYKNWVRDGSITAIALDASGHTDEAARYWRWMASVQGKSGSWKTTYSSWDGGYLSFVEPEYDSIGAFLYGVFRHHRQTGDAAFLADLWPAVELAANGILSSLAPNGLGAADFSIWEEPENGLEHHSFTQAFYVAGLFAAQRLAELRGDTENADWFAGGAASICTALQRPSTWGPAGMWNPAGYYNRGINSWDGSVQPMQDSSSNALLALGVVDPGCARAARHIATLTGTLTHDGFGIARYANDPYYFSSRFDPAGDEVGGPSPSWPQMSMWVAIHETQTGQQAAAHSRLQWFASRTGAGYMAQGEAVSNVTHQSVQSSMSEPLTAASYLLALLCYSGRDDVRILPPIYNAGAYKPLTVNPGTTGDWAQWGNVPYFVGALAADAAGAASTIRRVFVANDDRNLYLRIDAWANALPGYRQTPLFGVRVYVQDFANGGIPSLHLGVDGQPIGRPASFALERHSNDDVYGRWTVSGGLWTAAPPLTGVIAPQWDSALGRLEVVIPIAAVSSAPPALGSAWGTLAVALSAPDAGGTWRDGPKVLLHYRLSSGDQPWTFGNIEVV